MDVGFDIVPHARTRHAAAWGLAALLHVAVFLLAGGFLTDAARFAVQTAPGGAELELDAWTEPDRPPPLGVPESAVPVLPNPPPAPAPVPIATPEPAPSPSPPPVHEPPRASAPTAASSTEPAVAPPVSLAAPVPSSPAQRTNVALTPVPEAARGVAPVTRWAYAQPDYARNPPPPYPRSARHQGHQGVVLIEVRVSTRGTVETLRVAESSGHPVLDAAALKAVRQWRFHPARAGGLPIASTVEVPIRFALE